ncbi:hypothetical protein KCU99_g7240, partial [Aureobasidium melanogenum]
MFSLIRKISSSQHPRSNMAERSSDDDDKHESEQQEQQQEEVDGTSYDPDADPRDPGRYYTFPHFAEDKGEISATQPGHNTPERDPGTFDDELRAPHGNPGTSQEKEEANDQDSIKSQNYTTTTTTQTTPIPKSTSPSSAEAASPPFWPTSPLSKRLRPNTSSHSPSPPVLQRRSTTTSQPSSPQVSRVQPARRASAQTHTQQYKSPSSKYHSSPAARSLRSISAAQSPRIEAKKSVLQSEGRAEEGHSPVRKQQQQKRLSSRSQGSPKSDRGKMG